MTLNGVVAVISRYIIEFGSFWGKLHQSIEDVRSAKQMYPKESSFQQYMIYGDVRGHY